MDAIRSRSARTMLSWVNWAHVSGVEELEKGVLNYTDDVKTKLKKPYLSSNLAELG